MLDGNDPGRAFSQVKMFMAKFGDESVVHALVDAQVTRTDSHSPPYSPVKDVWRLLPQLVGDWISSGKTAYEVTVTESRSNESLRRVCCTMDVENRPSDV
uniref:Uncharacterized protein n=1 Tax=Peronospora matthiolae TaxID=2874970 RepID=A0AAV1USS7_9STRA